MCKILSTLWALARPALHLVCGHRLMKYGCELGLSVEENT